MVSILNSEAVAICFMIIYPDNFIEKKYLNNIQI